MCACVYVHVCACMYVRVCACMLKGWGLVCEFGRAGLIRDVKVDTLLLVLGNRELSTLLREQLLCLQDQCKMDAR